MRWFILARKLCCVRGCSAIKHDSARITAHCIAVHPCKNKEKSRGLAGHGGLEQAMHRNCTVLPPARRHSFLMTAQVTLSQSCFKKLAMRCYILARQLVLCARMLCNELKRQSQRSVRLRADHRALQPASTSSVPLAVIQPNQRCLLPNCPWHGTSEPVHEQQKYNIKLGVSGGEKELENSNPAADALCQKRSSWAEPLAVSSSIMGPEHAQSRGSGKRGRSLP